MFEGVYSAIFSVYDENMNVKKETVAKMVDYHLGGGLKGFYVCGGTGETVVLPIRTQVQMLDAVIDANNKRGEIIAHIGAPRFEDALTLVENANDKKIDAIASLPPSLQNYYKFDEVVEYYKILAKRSKAPVFAYITAEIGDNVFALSEELAKIENIRGMKLTIRNYYQFERICNMVGDKMTIFNGPDESMLCGLIMGADGAIGSTYNVTPKLSASIFDAFKKGDMDSARKYQRKLNDIVQTVLGTNIATWKALLTIKGFDMGYTVAPCKLLDEKAVMELDAKLKSKGIDLKTID